MLNQTSCSLRMSRMRSSVSERRNEASNSVWQNDQKTIPSEHLSGRRVSFGSVDISRICVGVFRPCQRLPDEMQTGSLCGTNRHHRLFQTYSSATCNTSTDLHFCAPSTLTQRLTLVRMIRLRVCGCCRLEKELVYRVELQIDSHKIVKQFSMEFDIDYRRLFDRT
jgi:hypothetical protein